MQQKLESVSGRFSCGDLLFYDKHYLSKVLVQKQSLTCELQIEEGYYNNSERRLKLKDICVHCVEEGTKSFLLSLHQIRERNMTDRYKCLSICIACIGSDKKVMKTYSKDNQ